jgi:hypothetical protein
MDIVAWIAAQLKLEKNRWLSGDVSLGIVPIRIKEMLAKSSNASPTSAGKDLHRPEKHPRARHVSSER